MLAIMPTSREDAWSSWFVILAFIILKPFGYGTSFNYAGMNLHSKLVYCLANLKSPPCAFCRFLFAADYFLLECWL